MPTRRIVYYGHPVLHRKARRVTEATGEIRDLLDDMTETMLEAPGVGLAAPQVGESLRAIVVREDIEEGCEVFRLLNPRILERDGEQEGLEGCLSLPTLHGTVIRSDQVVAEGTTLDGDTVQLEGEGLFARALQHEIDHLNGKVFLERADKSSLVWMVPDEEEESGVRMEPTERGDVVEAFRRLRERQEGT